MKTLASDWATSRARLSRSSIAALAVTMPLRQSLSADADPATRMPAESFKACATCSSRAWLSNGLGRKPNTPRLVAATAPGIVPCAVRMITGSVGAVLWMASNKAMPSMPSIFRSVITSWGRDAARAAKAMWPLSTACTS